MKNLNSNNRLKVLNRSVAFSRALCAVKKITAVVKGRQLALAAIVAAVSTVAVAAVLTPGFGILSAPVFARASFADPTDIQFKVSARSLFFGRERQNQQVIDVTNARETVMQQIVIAPGGHTGWHSHPGPVVVLIKSGQMSFYDSEDPTCTVRTYSAGDSFVDRGQGHVHIANNQGNVDLVLWATYFDVPPVDPSVPGSGAFRIDAPDPGHCSPKLANISARGLVQTGDNVMIGGFILSGANDANVIVRAMGPSLPVPGKLEDPSLELFDRNGTSIAMNDNWGDTQQAEITATGIPPNDQRESAIVATLSPGAYTAIVRGVNNTTGVALVEVYALQ